MKTPIGREFIILAISYSTVCSSAKVRMLPPILCMIDLLVDLISDSLSPFWCWPSAGTTVHLIHCWVDQELTSSHLHSETNSVISLAADMSCDP